MSETRQTYHTPEIFGVSSSLYTPPTVTELAAIFELLNVNAVQVASIIHTQPDTIHQYTTGAEQMPFAELYTLIHIQTGEAVKPGPWRRILPN